MLLTNVPLFLSLISSKFGPHEKFVTMLYFSLLRKLSVNLNIFITLPAYTPRHLPPGHLPLDYYPQTYTPRHITPDIYSNGHSPRVFTPGKLPPGRLLCKCFDSIDRLCSQYASNTNISKVFLFLLILWIFFFLKWITV